MSGTERLYTPELLALAVDLARWPASDGMSLHGDARSPTCGSTIAIDVEPDDAGHIAQLGLRVRACAVGQAAAAIFAGGATGRDAAGVETALASLESWLAGAGALPEWPGIAAIEAARGYPGRHGAILLPWRAALSALSSPPSDR